jgi:hypothetical protein
MTNLTAQAAPAPWLPDLFMPQMHAHQRRYDKRLAIGLGASLLIHALLLVFAPRHVPATGTPGQSGRPARGPLIVRITPRESAPPEAPLEPNIETRRAPVPSRPHPTVIAVPRPAPQMPPVALDQAPPASAAPLSFMALVEANRARRRAVDQAAGVENATAREWSREPTADEIATANINRNLQTLNRGRGGTSGIFQILNMGQRYGEFSFHGWTAEDRKGYRQVIEVDAGPRGDLELAMVRRMIELIRSHYQGNFNWESQRLDRVVVLSARLEDNAGLEEFLLREFFRRRG